MELQQAFRNYRNLGYQPILLQPKSKRPIITKWNKNYDANLYWKLLQTNSDYNLGFLLGEIIDVEGDNKQANNFLDNLLDKIDHPKYISLKSTHHLFRRRPGSKITRIHAKGVEIRCINHQSVVPPSMHLEDDFRYDWITPLPHISRLPILPIALEYKIRYYCKGKRKIVKFGHLAINCANCRDKKHGNAKRIYQEIEIFKKNNMAWICHSCRPFSITEEIRKLNV